MRSARSSCGTLGTAAAVTIAACSHPAHSPSTAPGATAAQADTAPATSVPLRVVSHTSSDLVIYAGRDHLRQRLGTITAATTRSLFIPSRFAADGNAFYLVAHRVGGKAGNDFTSPTVRVQPGQTVVMTVEFDVASSSVAVE